MSELLRHPRLARARPLEAVLFDWAGTLFRFRYDRSLLDRSWAAALAVTSRPDAVDPALLVRSFREHCVPRLVGRDGREEADYEALVAEAFRRCGVALEGAELRRFLAAAYAASAPARVLGDFAHGLLDAVRGHGMRVGIVSNVVEPGWLVRRELDRLGIAERIDLAVLSSEVGVRKPHPAIFGAALRGLGVEAASTLFVGDRLETDVAGARRLGMTTVHALWFHDGGATDGVEPDFRARRPFDVVEIVTAAGAAGGGGGGGDGGAGAAAAAVAAATAAEDAAATTAAAAAATAAAAAAAAAERAAATTAAAAAATAAAAAPTARPDSRARDDVGDPGLLNLKSNELIHPALPALLAEALATMPAQALGRYPRQDADVALLAARLGVPPDCVALSAGSDVAIRMLLHVLGAGGPVVLQAPNYETWEAHSRWLGLPLVEVAFGGRRRDAWSDELLAAAEAAAPGLVVISNPNGPTGWTMPEADVLALADAAGSRGHVLIVDECYGAFAGLDHVALLGVRPHVVVVRSFSKAFGIAGARLAAVVAAPATLARLGAWLPEGTVSAPALALVAHLCGRSAALEQIWRDIRATRGWFAEALAALRAGWSCLPSGGNFVNLRLSDGAEAAALYDRLLARSIRTRLMNGVSGLEGCVRFTIADRATMAPVLELVREFAADRQAAPTRPGPSAPNPVAASRPD